MKSFRQCRQTGNGASTTRAGFRGRGVGFLLQTGAFLPITLLMTCLALAQPAGAQAVYAGEAEGLTLFAGVTGSGNYLQYGQRKMLGFSGFVDVDKKGHLGVEAEGNWQIFHQTADVHTSSYMVGPRFRLNMGRIHPYAKALVGIGEFNFPYNLAHGSYLVVAPGGGVDFRLSRRIRLRLADAEWQYWPEFTYGATSSLSVSTGIRVRIF